MKRIVVAITGASGAAYALRLLQVLTDAGTDVHCTLSPAAGQVLAEELDLDVDTRKPDPRDLLPDAATIAGSERLTAYGLQSASAAAINRLTLHHSMDFSAGIASGSFLTDGMVICPCSLGTLGAIANGLSSNLIHRAADVHLKERRPLLLVPRETPLSSIQLRNMTRVSEAGAVVLPAMPGFYHRPGSLLEVIDFVVARICDQLQVPHPQVQRWSD